MRKFFITLFILISCTKIIAQIVPENISGKVSFVSSQNIYVKFKTTLGISAGDTLYIPSNNDLIPVLIVNSLSSTSCVCTAIADTPLPIDHLIIAKTKISNIINEEQIVEAIVKDTLMKADNDTSSKIQPKLTEFNQKIRGSLSLNSYSDFSNLSSSNSNRFRYTFSIDAQNISNSKFSFESYLSFKHKQGEWADVKNDVFNALKIYNLAVKYDLNKSMSISLGRKINQKISSIGAMDGLQFEKSINKYSMGAIVGSRPDFIDFSFNPKLFQFGAYVSYNSKSNNYLSESSLAFMQQMYGSKTDRRFLYFQHSNSIIKNLYFFSTFEVDLYKLNIDTINNKEIPKSTIDPVGLYLSLNYRISRKLTLSGSYDARKNTMYYESYKTFMDRVLETEIRQGFRLQANYRITNSLTFGVQSGYRFMKSDHHPSKNIYSYISYYDIPVLHISATITGTFLESNYMNGHIFGGNISRDFFQNKLQTNIGYRFVDYKLPENYLNYVQHIGEINISWLVYKNISLSINYEGTFEKQDKYNRIYLQVRKRF